MMEEGVNMNRNIFGLVAIGALTVFAGCGVEGSTPINAPTQLVDREVEAACGECQFKMEGKSCDLAVRIDGKSYYVDGSSIDKHGDAHADDGMCECVRKAKVTGKIENGRFAATKFEVLPK
jgi:hypothetical protein